MKEITIEQVETCPYCMGENVFPNYDPEEKGYVVTCQHCGKKIFLCDACQHAENNPCEKCDWHERPDGRGCFRGWIKKVEESMKAKKEYTVKVRKIIEGTYTVVEDCPEAAEFKAQGMAMCNEPLSSMKTKIEEVKVTSYEVISGTQLEVGYIKDMDLTVIMEYTYENRICVKEQVVGYYHGEPDEAMTKTYAYNGLISNF